MSAYEVVCRNWLVRYADVVDATIARHIPVRAGVALYDGRRLTIRELATGISLTRIVGQGEVLRLRAVH